MTDLFFIFSKVFWAILQPDHLLLLLLILGLLLWRKALGKLLVWGSIFCTVAVAIYPLGNFILQPLEQRFPQVKLTEIDQPLAGVIILGGGERAEISALQGRPEFKEGAERVMDVPALMLRYPDIPVIFTGGSSSLTLSQYRGGDVAKQWFEQQGLGSRLIIERDSRNTHENALYTRELIHEMSQELSQEREAELQPTAAQEPNVNQGKWLLITSAFHMPRSVGIYRKVGIDVLPYPVDYRVANNRFKANLNAHMADINTGVREWIGLLAYYYTGKTDQLFPGPCAIESTGVSP